MTIKKLQNDFTTPEQSKRLLELGVPADSADCFFASLEQGELSQPHMLYGLLYSKRVPYGYEKFYLPCWSVGRLMEIFVIARGYEDGFMSIDGRNPIEYLIRLFAINRNEKFKLDFSKLEE